MKSQSLVFVPCLIQMSGWEGVGKTTLANAIVRRVGNVRSLNKDVYLDHLLRRSIERADAGELAYELLFRDAAATLLGDTAVIVDSPVFAERTLRAGQTIARGHSVPYVYVECVLGDAMEHARRLASSTRLPHQTFDQAGRKSASTVRPDSVLRVNITGNVEGYVSALIEELSLRELVRLPCEIP